MYDIITPQTHLYPARIMMQPELLLPSWPNFSFPCSILNQEPDFCEIDDHEFSYSFASPDDSSVISSNSFVPISDTFFDLQNLDDQIQICDWINGDDTEEGYEFSPCLSFDSDQNFPFKDTSLVLPGENMEVDDQVSLVHLLRAYGEAMENGEKELAEVIVSSINEKSNPMGNIVERVAYNLFRSRDEEGEYLRQESRKNLPEAFKVLYQALPNGRIAHFRANSAILESIPNDAEVLHIVDFDTGEGIQWPPLIEALSRKQKAIRITCIIPEGEPSWEAECTKKQLLEHSRQHGVELQIEEKKVLEFCDELKMERRGQGREWLVFNCMVGLPHMGRRNSRKNVDEFVDIAKELVPVYGGILILGDGESIENLNYASYFDELVRHYQAVFESLERNFPVYLAEARTAMEGLFLAPLMCPVAWFQEWEETTKGNNFRTEKGSLEGRKISVESLIEAKEMVREGMNSYSVKIEGVRGHEMVLQWKETPLVRVSTWM